MFEVYLAIYLCLGFTLTFMMKSPSGRRLLFVYPGSALVIAISWPAALVMRLARGKGLTFQEDPFQKGKS